MSGDIRIGIDDKTEEIVFVIDCLTCREKHCISFSTLQLEVKKIREEELSHTLH